MIYVVSGYRRSGTSMMMRALYKGGLDCLIQKQQEQLNIEKDGYIPNPGGLFEVGQEFYVSPRFLRLLKDGDCVKILFDGLASLPRGAYKIIWMMRDEEEINASVARSDAHLRSQGVKENKKMLRPFDVFRPYNQDDIDHVIGICKARSDMELIFLDYGAVVKDPYTAFAHLKESGIPIDPKKAAAVVNPAFYRERINDRNNQSRGSRICPESHSNEQPAA